MMEKQKYLNKNCQRNRNIKKKIKCWRNRNLKK